MIIYRQMTEQDLAGVAVLEKECFTDPWSEGMFLSSISDKNQYFLVAQDGQDIVGYSGMMMVLDEGQILNVAVNKAYRHQGIGRRLMEGLIAEGTEKGMVLFTLEVRESNEPARGLYESLGFAAVGRRNDYYSDPVEAAVLMDLYIK